MMPYTIVPHTRQATCTKIENIINSFHFADVIFKNRCSQWKCQNFVGLVLWLDCKIKVFAAKMCNSEEKKLENSEKGTSFSSIQTVLNLPPTTEELQGQHANFFWKSAIFVTRKKALNAIWITSNKLEHVRSSWNSFKFQSILFERSRSFVNNLFPFPCEMKRNTCEFSSNSQKWFSRHEIHLSIPAICEECSRVRFARCACAGAKRAK